MKMRIIGLLLAIVAILATGCTNAAPSVSALSLDDVLKSMKDQGLQLIQIHPKYNTHFDELNHVSAETYAIDTYKMDNLTDTPDTSSSLALTVNVYVFIFDSSKDRAEGREQLDSQMQLANFAAPPAVYENRNALVVYFRSPDDNPEYERMINSAVSAI